MKYSSKWYRLMYTFIFFSHLCISSFPIVYFRFHFIMFDTCLICVWSFLLFFSCVYGANDLKPQALAMTTYIMKMTYQFYAYIFRIIIIEMHIGNFSIEILTRKKERREINVIWALSREIWKWMVRGKVNNEQWWRIKWTHTHY